MFNFWILHQILNVLKEEMIAIANVFPKLQTVKELLRPLSQKPRFRTRFDSQHVKAAQIHPESPWGHFYHVFSSFSQKLISKLSPLVLGEILLVFVITLTADEKYPFQDCENLPLPIQMQLSGKRKAFSQFLFHFWNLHHILNILKEKMIVIANAFPKLQTVKNLFRTLSKRRRFRAWFDSQHIKRPKNLWNLHESTFIMFFHHFRGSWFGKCLP